MDVQPQAFDIGPRRAAFLGILGLLLLAIAFICVQPSPSWNAIPGYRTLALDKSLDPVRIDEVFEQAGFSSFVSKGNIETSLSVWGRIDYRRLDNLGAAVSPEDPRHSRWLDRLGRVFSDEQDLYNLWYFPEADFSISGIRDALFALGLKEGSDWFLLQAELQIQYLALGIYAVLVLILFLGAGRGKIGLLLMALPFVPLVVWGGYLLLPCLAIMLFSLSAFFDGYLPGIRRYVQDDPGAGFFWDFLAHKEKRLARKKSFEVYLDKPALLFRGLVWLLSGLALSIYVFFSFGLISALGVLIFLPSFPGLIILSYARFLQFRNLRMEHRLFAPVPIISRSNVLYFANRKFIPGLFILLLLSGGLFVLSSTDLVKGPELARRFPSYKIESENLKPQELFLSYWPKAEAALEDRISEEASLPGLEDYVEHILIQTLVPWLPGGVLKSFPAWQDSIIMAQYQLEAGPEVSTSEDTVVRFDETWLEALFTRLPLNTLEEILLKSGHRGRLVYQSAGGIYFIKDWALPFFLGAGIFFMIIWFFGKHASYRQWYDVRASFNQMRKLAV